MLQGFNPQPFSSASTANTVNDDYFEEEKKTQPSKSYFTIPGAGSYTKQILTYDTIQEPKFL